MSKRCYGEPVIGGCQNTAGPRNPVWCDECDKKRIARISKQMEALVAHFNEEPRNG